MKRCQLCGSAMRVDAELLEGERHYTWFKCLNINCGSIFLIQTSLKKKSEAEPESADHQASAAAG